MRHRKGPFSILVSITTLFCLSIPLPVMSQVLEEIIVSARKRQESLIDVPISISAFTGAKMDEYSITQLQDMANFLPGVSITSRSSTGGAVLNIRGIATNGTNAGWEQAVGQFQDGHYVGRAAVANQGQFDLQQIEIMKGPQSTYFGKNTIAGAINIITRNPTEEFGGYVKAGYEFDAANEWYTEGVVSGALSDTFKARAAIRFSDSDGWGTNANDGGDILSTKESLARVTLVWDPTDAVSMNTKLNYADYETLGQPFQAARCTPGQLARYAGAGGIEDCVPDQTVSHVLLSDAQAAANGRPDLAALNPEDEYEGWSIGNTINWDITDDYTLTHAFSYRTHENFQSNDVDGFNLSGNFFRRFEDYDFWSNELRIVSDLDGRVNWMGGFYYAEEDLEFNAPATTLTTLFPGPFGGSFGTFNQQDTTSWSFFGEVSFDITDQLELVLGGRYEDTEKDINHQVCIGATFAPTCDTTMDDFIPNPGIPGLPFPPPAVAPFVPRLLTFASPQNLTDTLSESEFSPSVTLSWSPTDDSMYYASWSEGFKAGGFDFELRAPLRFLPDSNGDGIPDAFVYDSENATAYEIGAKLTLLGGALQLNVAAFRTETEDLQVSTFDGQLSFVISNAAEAVSQGVEFEATWSISESLTVGATAMFLDSEFESYNGGCAFGVAPDAPDGVSCILDGNDTEGAMPFSANIFANYQHSLSDDLKLSLTGDASRNGSTIANDADPFSESDEYWRLNASVAISDSSNKWRLALIGRNLSDEDDYFGFGDLPGAPGNYSSISEPGRRLTVEAQYNF